jgi:hypothetical protein
MKVIVTPQTHCICVSTKRAPFMRFFSAKVISVDLHSGQTLGNWLVPFFVMRALYGLCELAAPELSGSVQTTQVQIATIWA